jgi:glycogen operon protein
MTLAAIDVYPTHHDAGYDLRVGRPFPFGATTVPGGINFSVFSSAATACTLVLFDRGCPQPRAEIPFPEGFRIGHTWAMTVFNLDLETMEYGYRMDGPWNPAEGHRFDPSKILLDPYARAIGGRDIWGAPPDWDNVFPHRGRVVFEDFDWEGDRPLETPIENLVVYEAHARGLTRHPSSGVRFPGSFGGIREKIPYLRELGINCIELLPIFEFDEFENSRTHPETGELLVNFWGYSTVGFFAPKAGYAATGKFGMQVDELKGLVKALHKNGIEIFLDVVFNHTAEGNEKGPHISFRGLDNRTYYMLTPEGYYYNFSGTGNTLNCNNPVVRNMVVDCLRYWAAEYHIDGFRFDLAAILGRAPSGAPLPNPPLLESLAFDPILAKCKLIAEAWDAGGLYQVGSFPAYGRWGEWNGKYRDTARRFLKGDEGLVGDMAQRVMGSPDLYYGRGTGASLNFIACHDGFTLADMVAYNDKHNEANGENNQDGANDNNSWNCGAEGPTDDPAINQLRSQQIKNAFVMLLVSQGVPMILSGDEVARTQHGNNNAYCHDSELGWLDWTAVERNAELLRFVRNLVAFRHAQPVLRSPWHLTGRDYVGGGYADVTWHGTNAWAADWSSSSRVLAFLLAGDHALGGSVRGDDVYVALNMHWQGLEFHPPQAPHGREWHVAANTGAAAPFDSFSPGSEPRLENHGAIPLSAHSALILVSK